MTQEEANHIIDVLHARNGNQYNLLKAAEECQELALALIQKVTKVNKPDDQEIIDEIGDVMIRVEILQKIFSQDLIRKRVEEKLSKFQTYLDHEKYKQI